MLERIEKIQGIGLLHDIKTKSHKFAKATLIYADNGRGKSTFTAVLRAAAIRAENIIEERRTLDGTMSPRVILRFANGINVEYNDKKWTGPPPDFLIFDSSFIEENVHSGGSIGPEHRKNLLRFALGKAAVNAQKKEEAATIEATKASENVKRIIKELAGFHGSMPLSTFEKKIPSDNIDEEISGLQKTLALALNSAEVHKRPTPKEISVPSLSLPNLFSILRASIEDIQDDAERIVKLHLSHSASPDIEEWISSGLQFITEDQCPYCSQSTSGVELISAYRTYFNAAYAKLKKEVSQLRRGLEVRLDNSIISNFIEHLDAASAQRTIWSEDLTLPDFGFDRAIAEQSLLQLNVLLSVLVTTKMQNPTASVGSIDEMSRASELWETVLSAMQKCNKEIQECSAAINSFKKSIAQELPAITQSSINILQISKRRSEPAVVELIEKLMESRKLEAECIFVKKQARADLDNVTVQTLGKYEKSINSLLSRFGASFNIEKLDSNFHGGAQRSEYGISMRGKSISLDNVSPRFSTTLSDGDKRTLAFSFFIASSAADPELEKKIIVIDDPMCSLDAHRKQHTISVLKTLHSKADQIIVLAHDPFFIRDLRDAVTPKDGQNQVHSFQFAHAVNGYSEIQDFDIDLACESPYYRHHRTLKEFCEGGKFDSRDVAKSLRPFLEGYVHRRFPRIVPTDLTFGQAIGEIKKAIAPSPLTFAQLIVDELGQLNDYSSQFHHDTNQGNAEVAPVNPTELRSFCLRALNLVYSGTVNT